MNVVITGSDGFIARNLSFRLREYGYTVSGVNRSTSPEMLAKELISADFVFHLAGTNRPETGSDYWQGNVDYTKKISDILGQSNRKIPVVLSSSIQVKLDNQYGESKRAAEKIIQEYSDSTGADHYIFRLPNVFGKWCKPNYNSFIATFCNNIAHGIDIRIDDPSSPVTLVYVDDVCETLCSLIKDREVCKPKSGFYSVEPQYKTTVGEVASMLSDFKASRETLISEDVGDGLERALYATFLSYLPVECFKYEVPVYRDDRGLFCEMLKTKHAGQFSFFTARPGVTRGGHYHHTKNEKFLVLKGQARFKFKNIATGECQTLCVDDRVLEVVVTIPGWCHDITNIGEDDLIVMLWANEIFNRDQPDTFDHELF